jgi:hypothetical protein
VAPPSDATYQRVRQLFAAVYALPSAVLHDVTEVEVVTSDFQLPLFPPRRLAGTWTQTAPNHARTDVLYESSDALTPEWLDVATQLAVTVVLEVDSGEIETLQVADIGDFTTLGEFEAKFRYFDLAAFMAEHQITTVDELKRAYRYLLGQIRLRKPGTFDPGDAAHRRRFELNIAVLIRDGIDVTGCLRDTRLAREVAERSLPYRRTVDHADVRTPYAPLLILPADAVPGTGFTVDDLTEFFAGQDVLAVFLNP